MVTAADRHRTWVDTGLLALLAIAAKLLVTAGSPLPLATTALLLSIGLAGVFRVVTQRAAPTLRFQVPLSFGLVLLGVQMVPERLTAIGLGAPLWLLGYWITMAALFAVAVRRRVFSPRLGGLLAVGMSGAGLAAVQAAVRADRRAPAEALPLATSGILVAGALGFVLSLEGSRVLAMDAPSVARWAGIALPTTAESVLVGAAHSPEAQELTAGWRLLINLLQVLPVLVYLQVFLPEDRSPGRRRILRSVGSTLRRVPLFVWGLSIVGAFGWLRAFSADERHVLRALTNWALLMALCGVGFNTRPREVLRLGSRRLVTLFGIWLTCNLGLLAAVLWLG